jgi:hypothetical protein
MEYVVGTGLAVGVGVFATLAGLDRERAFYPTVLIVIASYYDLFAIIGRGMDELGIETGVFALFAALAVLGFRTNLWIVVGALIGHGLFDLVHGQLIENADAPIWWPMFCLSYDVVAGVYLALLLVSKRVCASGRLRLAKPGLAKDEIATTIAAARTTT